MRKRIRIGQLMDEYLEEITDIELSWLAAAIECDGYTSHKELGFYNTEKKLVEKAAKIMCSPIRTVYRKEGLKEMFGTRLTGIRAEIMYKRIKPYLTYK